MADEKKIEVSQAHIQDTELGTIRVDDEVIAAIVAITTNKIKGVANTVGGMTDNFTGMLGKKNLSKGVRVDLKNDRLVITVNIIVKYGYGIPDLAHTIQNEILEEVEIMTGKKVDSVNLMIQGIVFDNNTLDGKMRD